MTTETTKTVAKRTRGEVVAEHGFPGVKSVHGVTWDGASVWFAHGNTGELVRASADGALLGRLAVPGADAGVAFDGTHLWAAAGERLVRVDRETGAIDRSVPAPDEHTSGLAYHDGALWVGSFRGKKIHKVDPATGAVLRTIACDRFVTGVSFTGDELWHGTYEGEVGDERTDLRRVDPSTGATLEIVDVPEGVVVSGIERDGARTFCGDFRNGKVRVIRRA